MLSLLEGIAPERLGDFRISLPLGNSAHGKIHAHFRALPGEIGLQALIDFRIYALCNADDMLRRIRGVLHRLRKAGSRRLALGAEFRGILSFIYITANFTYKFFHRIIPPAFWCIGKCFPLITV